MRSNPSKLVKTWSVGYITSQYKDLGSVTDDSQWKDLGSVTDDSQYKDLGSVTDDSQ